MLHCGQDLEIRGCFEGLYVLCALLYDAEQECPQNLLGGKIEVLQCKHSIVALIFLGRRVLWYLALHDLEQKIPGLSFLGVNEVSHCLHSFNILLFMRESLVRIQPPQPTINHK
jgi:hypothetical protein